MQRLVDPARRGLYRSCILGMLHSSLRSASVDLKLDMQLMQLLNIHEEAISHFPIGIAALQMQSLSLLVHLALIPLHHHSCRYVITLRKDWYDAL